MTMDSNKTAVAIALGRINRCNLGVAIQAEVRVKPKAAKLVGVAES